MWNTLSPAYQKRVEDAATRRRYYKRMAQLDRQRMEAGPRMEGRWIVIPSAWYNEEAKTFWKALGARFHTGDPEDRIWILDTRRARYDGCRYGPTAWLRSVRRRYYELYPELEDCHA